jgi:hypothetical protein
MAFHKSNLGKFGEGLPTDLYGYVAQEGDDWRDMDFDLRENDPFEDGISDEEKSERLDYLDNDWWPIYVKVLTHLVEEAEKSAQDYMKN